MKEKYSHFLILHNQVQPNNIKLLVHCCLASVCKNEEELGLIGSGLINRTVNERLQSEAVKGWAQETGSFSFVPALSFRTCITSGNLFSFTEPQFLHL